MNENEITILQYKIRITHDGTFKFKPNSKLQQYIAKRNETNKSIFTFAEILAVLRDAVHSERLYDERNSKIILCSPELEESLNIRALHVSELTNLVLLQLIRLNNDSHSEEVSIQEGEGAQNLRFAINYQVIYNAVNRNAKFTCKPKFLAVLKTIPEIDNSRLIFKYEEILVLLIKYILRRKDKFFDHRNKKLAFIGNDLLGEAFNVTAFHKCQLHDFVQDQLIPYNPVSPSDMSEEVNESTSAESTTTKNLKERKEKRSNKRSKIGKSKKERERKRKKGIMAGIRSVIPECHVCLEKFQEKIHVYNCFNGHFTCGTCINSMICPRCNGEYINHFICKSCTKFMTCPRCNEMIIGRAHDFENMINNCGM